MQIECIGPTYVRLISDSCTICSLSFKHMVYLEKPDDFKPSMEVVSCFLEYQGRFLLLHRASHRPQGGTWGTPAGKMEKGEDRGSAVVREIREEIGINLDPNKLSHFKEIFVRFAEYDFPYHIFHYSLDEEPLVTLSDEHTEYRWVTADEALKMDLIQDEDECIKLYYSA